MSDVPAWLSEDTTKTVATSLAKNPQVQAAAYTAAKDPAVQAAAFSAARQSLSASPSDPNAPSWATSDPVPPPSRGPAAGSDVEKGMRQIQSQPETEIDPDTLRRMKNWHLLLRLSYMSAAIIMAAAAVISLEIQSDVALAFFAIYVFVFAILIFCFEVNLSLCARPLAINFGFMYTLPGRAIFLLFVAFMIYSLQIPLAYAAFAILLAVGVLHMIILFKFPLFETYLRRLHYDSGGRK